MRETIRALCQLQDLDKRVFQLRNELERLPKERDRRRGEIDLAIQQRDTSKHDAMELRVRIKEIEDMTTTQRTRMRKVDSEAAGSRADMAMLAAFQHEIKTLKRSISDAEEEGLQLMEQADTLDAEVERMSGEIEEAEKVYAEFCANIESETSAAQNELDELLGQREQRLSDTVKPESMATYDRILAARDGVAMAELDGRVCQVCFMEVPPNVYVKVARGTALTQCPSCDRILFLRD